MRNKKINEAIINTWNEYSAELGKDLLKPIFYDDFTKQSPVLFIGSNPSFSKGANKFILRGSFYENHDFKWSEVSKKDPEQYVKDALDMDKLAYEKYSLYFKKFIEIAKYLNLPWEHVDLFFYRETDQKKFHKFIYKDKKQTELTDFGKKQLKISLSMIEQIKPSIILVANASAAKIFRENQKIFHETFPENGFHTIKINGRTVPIFFSSMISGQRALDNNSLERLKWHMKKALTETLAPALSSLEL